MYSSKVYRYISYFVQTHPRQDNILIDVLAAFRGDSILYNDPKVAEPEGRAASLDQFQTQIHLLM